MSILPPISGVIGLFKEMELVPFKEINLFWHLGALSGGIWLINYIERLAANEAK